MKCSFDFDDTLSRPDVQEFAEKVIKSGVEVWVVTSRMSNERAGNDTWNNDLEFVAKYLGIDNIHYCNLTLKSKFFKDRDFLFHLDDDIEEIQDINSSTDTRAIHFVPTIRMEALNECISMLRMDESRPVELSTKPPSE